MLHIHMHTSTYTNLREVKLDLLHRGPASRVASLYLSICESKQSVNPSVYVSRLLSICIYILHVKIYSHLREVEFDLLHRGPAA